MAYVTRSGSQLMYEGKRFRFVGVNFYPFIVESTSQSNMQNLFAAAHKKGISVFRTWCFDAGDAPSNSGGNFRYLSGGQLLWREATLVQLDTLLDEARKKGIKLILSLADNPTYNTKKTYVNWANSIYSSGLSTAYPYVGFFDSNDCRQLYKDFVLGLCNRVNTINGRTYKDDDTIFSWELGNELRYDVFDAEGGTQNTINSTNIIKVKDWINVMSAYIKSIDSNHLVGFGAMSHTWQWVEGDTVSNGSGYGVDYNIFSALTNIDYLDFHNYPTQSGTTLHKFGQRLGYPNAVTGAGFTAQIQDYVSVGHANDKPVICGEIGFDKDVTASNAAYPLAPRQVGYNNIFNDFFNAGGDGMILWHSTTGSGGSYSLVLDSTNPLDDLPIMDVIRSRNFRLMNKRIGVG